jgi:hypothetical protein
MYDFIDRAEFFKKNQKKIKMQYTEFDNLLHEKDQFFRKWLFKAYMVSNGNLTLMAKGLHYSRKTTYNYLIEVYGKDYRKVLQAYKSELENLK